MTLFGSVNSVDVLKQRIRTSFVLIGLTVLLLLTARSAGLFASFCTNIGFVSLAQALQQDALQQRDKGTGEDWFLRVQIWAQPVRSLYGLGRAYLLQERYVEAAQVLERGAEVQPCDPLLHLALGDAYDGSGDRAKAVSEWRAGEIKLHLVHRGQKYEQNREWEKAAYWYMAAREVDPDWAAPYFGRGKARRAQGMIPEAIYCLQRAASITPEDPFVHHQLGLIYMSQGQVAQAIQEFEQVLRFAPDDVWTTIYLASLYLEQGNLDEAAYHARRASARSTHPRPHFVLGTVYRKQGLLEKAIVEFEEAVRLVSLWNQNQEPPVAVSEVIRYYLALADAYCDAGQVQKAISIYEIVLDLDPQNAQATEVLQKLGRK